jgi:hypothetical protein
MAPLGIEAYTGNWQSLARKRQTKQLVKSTYMRSANLLISLAMLRGNADQENLEFFSDVEGADASNVGRYSYARGGPQRSKIQPKELAGRSPGQRCMSFILRESHS